jgi:hypothetical protein
MPIAPGDSPTQCDEDLIRCKEVPFGGGNDNKFHLGSDFPLNFTEISLAGSRKRMNVLRQTLSKDHCTNISYTSNYAAFDKQIALTEKFWVNAIKGSHSQKREVQTNKPTP